MKTPLRFLVAFGGILAAFALLGGQANAQAVIQAYQSDSALQVGMIVQLDPKDASKLQVATQNSSNKIHGVVVAANDAPLALSGGNSTKSYAATSGTYRVLVSDQNGAVQKNDYIVVSSLGGVGMKADATSTYVLGKALDTFDGEANVQGQTTIKDAGGQSHIVHFGYVSTDISIARNPLYETPKSNVPDFLQKLTNSVVNKPVSAVRIYIGLIVLLATVVIVFSLLYAGVRTSIVSLGRNPLAKKSIMRNLFEVVLIGLIVLISGIFGVYLLLKL